MIKEFKSGHWYRWTGPKERPVNFNPSGQMDFILDGKPHQCNDTGGHYASFFDSEDPQCTWDWRENLEHLEEVSGPLITKPLEDIPWWWDGRNAVLCWLWDDDREDAVKDYVVAFDETDDFHYITEKSKFENAEPVTEQQEEYFITKKQNGDVVAETKLTDSQLKELGIKED